MEALGTAKINKEWHIIVKSTDQAESSGLIIQRRSSALQLSGSGCSGYTSMWTTRMLKVWFAKMGIKVKDIR